MFFVFNLYPLINCELGVGLIAIKGEDNDHFVVIGESVDPVKLVSDLRKKVGNACIVSVNKVKDDDEEEDEDEEEEEDDDDYYKRKPKRGIQWCPNFYYPYSSTPPLHIT